MIAYFINFFAGHQTFLLIAFVLASLLYLIYSYSYLYNVKINFKNFCLNSDYFKINIDSPSCNSNPTVPDVKSVPPSIRHTSVASTSVASTSVASITPTIISPTGGNILPNAANVPIKTTSVSSITKS